MPRKPTKDEQALAALYRRVFTTDDGKRVLADMEELFPPEKPRCCNADGVFVSDPLAAFFTDGQRFVVARIRALVKGGAAFPHTAQDE